MRRQALGRIARGFHYECQQTLDAANGRLGAPDLAKTCCVLEGAGFEEPVPIANAVRNALVIVPGIEVALGVGCVQSIPGAYMGD